MQTITEAVSLEKIGSVGMLWIDNPPVNVLGVSRAQRIVRRYRPGCQ